MCWKRWSGDGGGSGDDVCDGGGSGGDGNDDDNEGRRRKRRVSMSRRTAVKTAVLSVKDMVVWLDEDVHPMVGQDVVITAHVKNVSSEDRHVHTTMTVCTKLYTNLPQDAKGLAKKQFPDMLLKAGCGG